MVIGNLPDGWETTTIGDSLKIVRGISFPKDAKTYEPSPDHIACLRTANVQQEVEWDDLWFVPSKHVKRDEQYIQPLDILISTANSLDLVGKVAQVKTIPHPSTLGAFISLIRVPSGLDSKFIYYQLASSKVQADIRSRASTTTNISNISTGRLTEVPLVIPPLPEQERIVSRIEELFSDLEAGVAALERVRAGLRRYRASVLKAAVEGRLVNGNLGIEEGGLPEGWRWVKLGEIADFKNGINFTKEQKGETGIPTIDVLNMYSEGIYVDLKNLYRVNIHAKDDYLLKARDILFVRSSVKREGVGWVSLYKPANEPITFCGFIIRARLTTEDVDPEYLAYYLRSDRAREIIVNSSSQVTITNINQTALGKIPIPLPPLEEQRRIVAEVERRLSVVGEVESAVEAGLVRASRMRQAVLRSAFEGRLT